MGGNFLGLAPAIPSLVVSVLQLHFLVDVNKGLYPLALEWHQKFQIGLTTSTLILAIVGGPFVAIILSIPLTWHGYIVQKLVATHILNKTSQISRGKYPWSFIFEIIGSKTLVKEHSSLFQDLPSDLVTPNTSELGIDSHHRRVVQDPQ